MERFSSFALYKAIRLKEEEEAIRLLSSMSRDHLKQLLVMPLWKQTNFPHLMAKYGASKVFKQVLSRLPPDDKLKLLRWKSDCTVLHVAVEKGHSEIIQIIFEEIKNKSDLLNLLLARADDGRTVLHVAVVSQTPGLFQLLVNDIMMDNKEIDQQNLKTILRVKDDTGSTVLHLAVQHTQTGIIKWILDKLKCVGCDWKRVLLVTNDEGNTLLHGAVELNSVELITIFIQFMNDAKKEGTHIFNDKVDVLMARNDKHFTVMQIALQQNNRKIISTIMKSFSSSEEVLRLLSTSCCSGETLLEYIVKNCCTVILRCILKQLTVTEKNQLVWAKNFKGETLHEVAACYGDQDMLACFEEGINDGEAEQDKTSISSTGEALKLFPTDDRSGVDMCEERVDHLASAAGNRPILVISVAGCSRKDRSFLMHIITELFDRVRNSGWSEVNASTIQDFLNSMSVDARTQGVDIWSEPMIFKKNDEEIAILLTHSEQPTDGDSYSSIRVQCDIAVTSQTRNQLKAKITATMDKTSAIPNPLQRYFLLPNTERSKQVSESDHKKLPNVVEQHMLSGSFVSQNKSSIDTNGNNDLPISIDNVMLLKDVKLESSNIEKEDIQCNLVDDTARSDLPRYSDENYLGQQSSRDSEQNQFVGTKQNQKTVIDQQKLTDSRSQFSELEDKRTLKHKVEISKVESGSAVYNILKVKRVPEPKHQASATNHAKGVNSPSVVRLPHINNEKNDPYPQGLRFIDSNPHRVRSNKMFSQIAKNSRVELRSS